MVHPSELLRNDNEEDLEFAAPVDINIQKIDCGILKLPFPKFFLYLERYADTNVFLAILVFTGFLNGAILSYFRGTAWFWAQNYNFFANAYDWLIYSNEIFVGILALTIAYWGNRIHKMSWLGTLLIFQTVVGLLLMVPKFYEPVDQPKSNNSVLDDFLCVVSKSSEIENSEINYNEFFCIIMFQMLFATVTISFICHGLTYLDDHLEPHISPAYISFVIASFEFGKYAGTFMSWIPRGMEHIEIFTSPVWITLLVLIFICGVIIAMFPRNLPALVIQQAVASLMDLSQGDLPKNDDSKRIYDNFKKVMLRLLKNKALMIMIFSSALMNSGVINFTILQKMLTGYSDPWLTPIKTNLFEQPFVGISIITIGLIIAKFKPTVKHLIIWMIFVFTLTTVVFASFGFISCDTSLNNDLIDRVSLPYCSVNCNCDKHLQFTPVCSVEGKNTYFSPCHAGCTSVETMNNVYVKLYSNCTCGANVQEETNTIATVGPCTNNCDIFWTLIVQIGNIKISALLATTVVVKYIIYSRLVITKDKAIAFGLELTFSGIIPYIPFKLLYDRIADNYCKYQEDEVCQLHDEVFGKVLSGISACLMGLATLVLFVMFKYVKDLDIYVPNDENCDINETYNNLEFENANFDLRERGYYNDDVSSDEIIFELPSKNSSELNVARNNSPTMREEETVL